MSRPTHQQLKEQVFAFNRTHPVGTHVMRYKLINPLAEGKPTRTRSEAWVLGGHAAVVLVAGVSGAVSLDSIKCISPEEAAAARDVADAIHAQSKGLPTQELLAQADERAAQAHLSIKKTIAVREADRTTK